MAPKRIPEGTTEQVQADDGEEQLCLLVFRSDGIDVHPLPATGELTIGRAEPCALRIADTTVSREHAVLRLGAIPAIRDLGSENGTSVRQRRLEPNVPAPLRPGEAFEVGKVLVVFNRGALAFDAENAATFMSSAPQPPRPPAKTGGGASQAAPFVVVEPAMERVFELVERVAPSNISVLLLGETGSGKEVVAHALHRTSNRSSGPFVRINCAALPENLVESELFGHEKGSFTGATHTKRGLLVEAERGTVFLDEVGELSAAAQAKLLRAIDAREVLPVGAVKARPINVRFVAATHRDLAYDVEQGRFRQDLFYRLNGISVAIPPLRERPSEIAPLAQHFLAAVGRADSVLGQAVRERLAAHPWLGNVRELRNVMERAAALAGSQPLELSHILLETASQPPTQRPERPASAVAFAKPVAVRTELEALERQRVLNALEECAGNQTRAAKLLGMPRRTFVKRLDAYGVARPRKSAAHVDSE